MINVGKHDSYENPPDLPYFRGRARKHTSSCTSPCSSTSTPASQSTSVSPGKRISMRTELLSQIDQWHSLLEKGGITQEQYDKLQSEIIKDIYSKTL